MTDWYRITNEGGVDSPALLVYPDRIRQNVALAKSMMGDVNRLRPHVKTHKTPQILQIQLDAGITKFKCATIAEAEMLGESGAPDVLLAYPLYGPKLERFIQLVSRFSHTVFSAVLDNEGAGSALSDASLSAGLVVDVYIDLDLGQGRTGIPPNEDAAELYRHFHQLKGLNVRGFHAYDGHVREVDVARRKVICDRNFEPIARLVDLMQSEGFDCPRVIIGGTPSFPVYADYPDVECSPGTFVLWDKGYGQTLPEQEFLFAAVLMCRVVSLIDPNRICVDLGYKAVASENPLSERVHFLDKRILKVATHSEEHLVLEVDPDHGFREGDVLYALPFHICPTVAMYDDLTVVRERKVSDCWPVVARKR